MNPKLHDANQHLVFPLVNDDTGTTIYMVIHPSTVHIGSHTDITFHKTMPVINEQAGDALLDETVMASINLDFFGPREAERLLLQVYGEQADPMKQPFYVLGQTLIEEDEPIELVKDVGSWQPRWNEGGNTSQEPQDS